MYNAPLPPQDQLPSKRQLYRSTLIALGVASLLLVTVVMPAEFGKDPTGAGAALGLTSMGEIKQSLAQEAALEKQNEGRATKLASVELPRIEVPKSEASVEPAAASQSVASAAKRSDEMKVTLAPNEGAEVKVDLKKGEKVNYRWASTGKTNYDTHADSKELGIKYHGYDKGSEDSDEGVIEAAFDGSHGWFWRNRTKQSVTLTLATNGDYTSIRRGD